MGQHFKVDLTIRYDNFQAATDSIFVGISAPSNLANCHDSVLTWHKIADRNIVSQTNLEVSIAINFGKFWKCGFYDWRIIVINGKGALSSPFLTQPPKTHSFPIARSRTTSIDDGNYMDEEEEDCPQAQGRFIVHAKGIRDQCFHEVQIDYQDARIDYVNQTFTQRGSFMDVANAIESYKDQGVTALYLMGVFERDNVEITGNSYMSYAD